MRNSWDKPTSQPTPPPPAAPHAQMQRLPAGALDGVTEGGEVVVRLDLRRVPRPGGEGANEGTTEGSRTKEGYV